MKKAVIPFPPEMIPPNIRIEVEPIRNVPPLICYHTDTFIAFCHSRVLLR